MKNIHDVCWQKEAEIRLLQHEIEVLRTVARLLADDTEKSSAVPERQLLPGMASDGTYSAARLNVVSSFSGR